MPLPAPRTWNDGEDPDSIPSADDLNLDWRDSWQFLLGYTKPMILVHHTTGSVTIQTASQTAIPFDTEVLKREMTHSNVTNNTRITVPYTGKYGGYAYLGFGTVSTLTSKFTIFIRANGTTQRTRAGQMGPQILGGAEIHASFSFDLTAGDYIEMMAQGVGSTAPSNTNALNRCKLALWYEGDDH